MEGRKGGEKNKKKIIEEKIKLYGRNISNVA